MPTKYNKSDFSFTVFEALANALMHRDYSVIGSEVHVDMYDDRLDIYSPGGMPDGSLIQNLDIEKVPSIRRNPAIADVFHRLDFAERQGSGLRRICEETEHLYGYTDEFAPKFVSTSSAFHVIFKNMNYDDLVADLVGNEQDDIQERIDALLDFCSAPKSRDEMQLFLGLADRGHFRKTILNPLLESRRIKMTIPDKPNSRNQKYVRISQ
jgi:ATP-dependent DNA helicase RecG